MNELSSIDERVGEWFSCRTGVCYFACKDSACPVVGNESVTSLIVDTMFSSGRIRFRGYRSARSYTASKHTYSTFA
jgi:hypothetical protein